MGEAFFEQCCVTIIFPYEMPTLTEGTETTRSDQPRILKMVDFSASVTDKDKGAAT